MAGINRREALAGFALTAAAGSVAAPALPRSIDRREWDVAMAAYVEAQRKAKALAHRVDAISTAYQKGREAIPEVGTAQQVRHARSALRSLSYIEDLGDNYAVYRGFHALVKADDERNEKIAALDKRLGWTAINDRYDALNEAVSEAETALLNMPAPDGEALMWKVERLYKPGDGIWSDGVEDQTHADLRRFLLNGRA